MRDPQKLKELQEKASLAMFELHAYLRLSDDDWWREIFRFRVEMNSLVAARLNQWKATKDTDGQLCTE